MPQTAMDASAFSEMKELMGDTFKEVLNLCIETLPEQLNAIEEAIDNDNAETLFNVSHKMKSSSGSIGAFGLAEKAEVIELIGRDGSTMVPEQAITDLRDATRQVLSIINKELNE
ncbi:MAG: Hpt domain-containing protein [Gammaproteobacteria bacterium]|nr:Hpt domain-containing protein [Gammaproteobacteria bacterium]MBT8133982.1 Hpt domain-containing protein [Gammaproteobacteria bacterium]NNJ49304.1 Hpt domain-containing protein [Gammaproteobacteria bacterium]